MTNTTNFIKIRVFIPVNENDVLIRNADGTFIGSPEFNELSHNADKRFREPIITFINEAIGTHSWAIKFVQFDTTETWYDARIYCKDHNDAYKIIVIVKEKLVGIKFNWTYEGDISKYIERL